MAVKRQEDKRERGENPREAKRQRDLRDLTNAINKGYDNKAIREKLRS